MSAIRSARHDKPLTARPEYDYSHFRERGINIFDVEAETSESLERRRQRRETGEHKVDIYRAAPRGIKEINTGDWVTPSPTYAREHAKHATDKTQDWPVYHAKVQAQHVRWPGDSINEFGYFGPSVKTRIKSRGGKNAESVNREPS